MERDCKGIVKRMCRENRMRVDKASKRIEMDGVIERRASLGTEGNSSTTRPTSTPISTSTATSTSGNSANSSISGTSSGSKYETRQKAITTLRVEALRLLGDVEEMQGKPERKIRWDCLATKLELEAG